MMACWTVAPRARPKGRLWSSTLFCHLVYMLSWNIQTFPTVPNSPLLQPLHTEWLHSYQSKPISYQQNMKRWGTLSYEQKCSRWNKTPAQESHWRQRLNRVNLNNSCELFISVYLSYVYTMFHLTLSVTKLIFTEYDNNISDYTSSGMLFFHLQVQ
jgi:hypothetical protein